MQKTNISKYLMGNSSRFLFFPILAFTVLAVFYIALSFCNLNTKSANATEASTNTEVALNVDSVINISAPTTATLNCTPGATAAAAQLCTTTASIGVGTNNITGYTLQMNATNGSPTALTNSAASPAATIPTLSQAYSSSNFPINSWGYTGGLDKSSETGGYDCSSNYCPILAYESTSSNYAPNHVIKATNAPATTSNTDITFGAKVDISKPSGTYSTSVTFTAVTNFVPDPDAPATCQTKVPSVNYMQEINSTNESSILAAMVEDQPYYIKDSRDEKVYCISKLKDGNLWMLDNLRLDLVASKNNITSSNTNASDTYLNYLKNGGGTTSDQYPTAGVSYADSSNYYSIPKIAIKNVDNENWNPDTVASVTYGNGSGKIGIYYNYCAASAGSYCWGNGTSYTGSPSSDPKSGTLYDIDADICPAGWHMPTTTSGGEYYYLYNTAYAANATNFKTALSTPLSGYFNNGSANYQGSSGDFWSSTWNNTYSMRLLRVNASNVNPSSSYDRYRGYSLRCIRSGS